jgi:hypothetical protein
MPNLANMAFSSAAMPESNASQRAGPGANNLPLQLTSFVGRTYEIAEVKRLLMTTAS